MQSQRWCRVFAAGMAMSVCALAVAQDEQRTQEAAAPAVARPADGKVGPRLEVNPKVFDFGEVWEGSPAKGELTIRNAGDEPLTLKSTSSCGCTVTSKPKSPLAPGESTTFTISYSTNRLGKANKRVYLHTNDPANAKFTIPVQGEVKPFFRAKPLDRISFRNVETNTQASETITLTNLHEKPVSLRLNQEQKYDPFEVLLEEIEPGREYRLTVSTKPPLGVGPNRAVVLLETDTREVPSVRINVSATVPPRAAVRPSRLYVFPNTAQPRTQRIQLEYRPDEPLVIKEVTCDIESVKFEVRPAEPGGADGELMTYAIYVTLPMYEEMRKPQGILTIHTDDESPQYQKIEVPIVKRAGPGDRRTAAREQQPKATPAAQPASDPQYEGLDRDELTRKIEEAIRNAQSKKQSEAKPEPKGAD